MARSIHHITRKSQMSGVTRSRTLMLDAKDYHDWISGDKPIQDAFPYLSSDDREFLKTGITSEEWDQMFA